MARQKFFRGKLVGHGSQVEKPCCKWLVFPVWFQNLHISGYVRTANPKLIYDWSLQLLAAQVQQSEKCTAHCRGAL